MSSHAAHLAQHIKHPSLRGDNVLHVVGVVSNPARYHSRYRLAREWREAMAATPNVQLHIVEAAFGHRQHEIVESSSDGLQLRTHSEIWIKENLINLAVARLLPSDWKYMAWVDADVAFRDSGWAQETLHELQHFPVVQPWQQCADLGFDGSILATHDSFGYLTQKGAPIQRAPHEPYAYGHTGFAWACTRDFWEATGGLLDTCILGSGDHHMAWAMVGDVAASIHGSATPGYRRMCHDWQVKAVRATQGEVGFVPGRIEHAFHGPKRRRFYQERWQILIDNAFDPFTDIVHDEQGLIQLVGKPRLESAIRKYNRSRGEDSIENE